MRNQVYNGDPAELTVTLISPTVLQCDIALPLNKGTFTYGNIGIFLNNNVMLALAALVGPETKELANPPGTAGNIINRRVLIRARDMAQALALTVQAPAAGAGSFTKIDVNSGPVLNRLLQQDVTVTVPNVGAGARGNVTTALSWARQTKMALVVTPLDNSWNDDMLVSARCSTAGTVKLTFANLSASANINAGSKNFSIAAIGAE